MNSIRSAKLSVVRLILFFRLYRFHRGLPYGAPFVHQDLLDYHISPLPSISTIGRVMRIMGLVQRGK